MRRRRTPRPGVTAAATTAVLATGDRPGLTAEATTAVLATGWPMTPTRPTRAALSGISVSFGGRADHVVGLDGGDDRLDRDPAVGDELASRASRGGCERRGPEVLPDEHARSAAGFHRGGEMLDVVGGEELRQLGLDGSQLSELLDIGELGDVDRTVVVLVEDQDVDDADRPRVDELEKLRRHLAGEVLRSRGELDDEVVDGAEVIEGCFCHRCPFSGRLAGSPTAAPSRRAGVLRV